MDDFPSKDEFLMRCQRNEGTWHEVAFHAERDNLLVTSKGNICDSCVYALKDWVRKYAEREGFEITDMKAN